MTFEEHFHNYLNQEYPALEIRRINASTIDVYHSEFAVGYSIPINEKSHNVKTPDDVKGSIDFISIQSINKFIPLSVSGYQYKNMVEVLIPTSSSRNTMRMRQTNPRIARPHLRIRMVDGIHETRAS